MNHADRQRLSQLLQLVEANITTGADPYADGGAMDYLAEARAIVDGSTSPLDDFTFTPIRKHPLREEHPHLFTERHEPPNPKLDAFLSEPIHEYEPRIPAGNHRHRHRALSPFRTALVLTIACIALICLTASSTPIGGTERPADDSGPLVVPPGAGEWQYLPNDYPENAP